MRNLINIIDQIVVVAPDLKDKFASLRESTLYTAPELMVEKWDEAAVILNQFALEHPKRDDIIGVFNGNYSLNVEQ